MIARVSSLRGLPSAHNCKATFGARMTMSTRSFPASFVRGGTSNGLIINRSDLPADVSKWQPILSSAMGSPDPFGRQLNGMGSGISSTSKICVIEPSKRSDADVDYTFVQVGIKDGSLDMAGNCGNMSSAVAPVAWNEGLLSEDASARRQPDDETGEVTLRMFNTNTSKTILSTFAIARDRGPYNPGGDYSIDGVPGTGSRITLSFLDPAGSKTGKALPTGIAVDKLELPDGNTIRASLTDIANPGVFILGQDVGLDVPSILPEQIQADATLMARLEEIRRAGAAKMGLDPNVQSVPKIVLISRPSDAQVQQGVHIACRALSMQQAHKASPLTLALNLGAACRIPGTLAMQTAVGAEGKESITIAHASGKLEVGSVIRDGKIESALLHRTARVMMKGQVLYTITD